MLRPPHRRTVSRETLQFGTRVMVRTRMNHRRGALSDWFALGPDVDIAEFSRKVGLREEDMASKPDYEFGKEHHGGACEVEGPAPDLWTSTRWKLPVIVDTSSWQSPILKDPVVDFEAAALEELGNPEEYMLTYQKLWK